MSSAAERESQDQGAEGRALLEEALRFAREARPEKALKRFRRAFELAAGGPDAASLWFEAACAVGHSPSVIEAGCARLRVDPDAPDEVVSIVVKAMLKHPPDRETLEAFDGLAEGRALPEAFEPIASLHAWSGNASSARRWWRRHCLSAPFAADGRLPDDLHDRLLEYADALQEDAPSASTGSLRASILAEAGRGPAAAGDGAPWAGAPLRVLVSPFHRKRLLPGHFLRRLHRADRGALVEARVRRPDLMRPGWVHPIYCGTVKRLNPDARDRYGETVLLDLVHPEVLEAVRRGEGCLLLDHGHEGLFVRAKDAVDVGAFLLHLQRLRLPAERVVILDGNLRSPERVAELARQAGAPGPKVIASRHGWLETSGTLRRRRQAAGGADEVLLAAETSLQAGRLRPRHFLSFNHAPRPHRCALLAALLDEDLLARGLVSFAGPEYVRSRAGRPVDESLWVARAAAAAAALVDLPNLAPLVARLAAMSPLHVDEVLQGSGGLAKALARHAHDAWPYLDSYVSFVTDTVFSDGSSSLVTEKLCRPLANLHPFVYLGEPGALAELRARGYATFAPLIDERYDELADPRERMGAALSEVRRLASMPLAELHELYVRSWPTLVHNYRRFMDGEPLEADGLVSDLKDYMSSLRA